MTRQVSASQKLHRATRLPGQGTFGPEFQIVYLPQSRELEASGALRCGLPWEVRLQRTSRSLSGTPTLQRSGTRPRRHASRSIAWTCALQFLTVIEGKEDRDMRLFNQGAKPLPSCAASWQDQLNSRTLEDLRRYKGTRTEGDGRSGLSAEGQVPNYARNPKT